MKKLLLTFEKQYVDFIVENFSKTNIEHIEEFLGCTFAYSDGQFIKDENGDLNTNANESLPIDCNNYRKYEDNNFPESYPCVMLYHFEKTFDRIGDVEFEICEFVYPKDFEPQKLESNKKRYKHNCEDCIFLKTFYSYDLYACIKNKSVLARFGNEPWEYASGIYNIGACKELKEAYNRACELPEFKELGWKVK